ncbi:MAG: TonB-dependent receptor [Microscillaceae bacterium]|jgi:TonB-dependent receptor|nr:TonB-dependent receptor [Microscillaceae bacterium]
MQKRLLFIFLTCLSLQWASAQVGSISGRVLDNQNLPLPGATVYIESIRNGAVSNVDGEFIITNVPSGDYVLKITYIGFKTITQNVSVSGGDANVSIKLEPSSVELSGVIVFGDQLIGQAKALNQQRMSDNVSNIVSADQIGRFPDANVGDALKRVPGITVLYDQGEARFGIIRGTEPRLNSVTINGERIPSAEGETRQVQLDLIPADMIQTIEVNKAILPDMDADAIGGSVNLVTRAAPNGFRASATLAGGYNALRSEPIYNGSLILGGRVLNNKLGIIFSGSYQNRRFGSDNAEGVWDRTDDGRVYVAEWDIRRYDLQRVRRSTSLSLDYKINSVNTITFRGIYNWRDDWENRYRSRLALGEPDPVTGIQRGRESRQTKGGIDTDRIKNARLEDQRMMSYTLRGDHLLANKYKLEWSATYSRASESRPDERYIEFRTGNLNFNSDYSNPEQPRFTPVNPIPLTAYGFRRIEDEDGFTKEEDFNSRVDLSIPVNVNEQRGSLKFGGRLRHKAKSRDNRFDNRVPTTAGSALVSNLNIAGNQDFSDNNYLAGDYRIGAFVTPEFLGRLNFSPNSPDFIGEDNPGEYISLNYSGTEVITAGYAMWKQSLNSKLSLTAGLRVENTNIDYSGFTFDDEAETYPQVTNTSNYTNLLPSLLLKYDLNDNQVIKASYTNTLARPNYYDLVPYRNILREDQELTIGNPALNPTRSLNLDVMYEKYWDNVGLLSGGVFFKSIRDFIYNQRTEVTFEGDLFQQFQRVNGAKATLFGIEVAFQKQLFKGFSVYANYTYTDSNIDSQDVPENIKDLPGTAPHMLNASLAFENKKLVLRAAFNYSSSFLDSEESDFVPGLERFYDRVTYLDLNGSYAINPKFRAFFEINNLLNQPLRYYAGVRERTYQAEFYGVRFNLGVKFDITR